MSELIKSKVAEFKSAIRTGIEQIVKASQIYVLAIDNDPNAKSLFVESCPDIPNSAWSGFEALGRGYIDKRLLWGGGRASRYLKMLPVSSQRNALDNGLEVLVNGDDFMIVNPENMTKKQCEQVFDGGKIRNLQQQKAWLESINTNYKPVLNIPYVIKDKKLLVNEANVVFTMKMLAKILQDME